MAPTSVLVNGARSLIWNVRLYSYGGVRYHYDVESGAMPLQTPYRYTSQRHERAILLYDYGARYYDMRRGRFIQPDTIIPEPGNPQSLNRYMYALGNPINRIDPTGHANVCGTSAEGCGGHQVAMWGAPYDEEGVNRAWALTEIGLSIAFEPADWVATARDFLEGKGSPWMLVGLLPGIPSGAGRIADDTAAPIVKEVVEHTDEILAEVDITFNRHHTVPREILKKYLPADVADAVRGKKGAPSLWSIPEELHKKLHEGAGGGAYNQRWIEEIGKLRDITAQAVQEIRDRLVKEFGIDTWRP